MHINRVKGEAAKSGYRPNCVSLGALPIFKPLLIICQLFPGTTPKKKKAPRNLWTQYRDKGQTTLQLAQWPDRNSKQFITVMSMADVDFRRGFLYLLKSFSQMP